MNVDLAPRYGFGGGVYRDRERAVGDVAFQKSFPPTVVDAFAKGEILQVMCSVCSGSRLAALDAAGEPVGEIIAALSQVLFGIVGSS